jgi:hypothetical protein
LSNIKNRKEEKEAFYKHEWEQRAAAFERDILNEGDLIILKYMSERGLEMLQGQIEIALMNKRKDKPVCTACQGRKLVPSKLMPGEFAPCAVCEGLGYEK